MCSVEEVKKKLGKEIHVHYHLPNPEPRLNPTELMELKRTHGLALACINQLESNYSQISKALCGKETATLGELLKTIHRVSRSLANAEKMLKKASDEREATNMHRIALLTELHETKRERDAVLHDLKNSVDACLACKWFGEECRSRNELNECAFEWRGPCPENTKEDAK